MSRNNDSLILQLKGEIKMKTILNMDFIQCDYTMIFRIYEQDDMLRSKNNEILLLASDYVTIGGKISVITICSDSYPASNFIIDKNLLPTVELYLRGRERNLDNRSAVISFPSEELASIFYMNIERLFRKFADLHSFDIYIKTTDYRWYKTMHITIEDHLNG